MKFSVLSLTLSCSNNVCSALISLFKKYQGKITFVIYQRSLQNKKKIYQGLDIYHKVLDTITSKPWLNKTMQCDTDHSVVKHKCHPHKHHPCWAWSGSFQEEQI